MQFLVKYCRLYLHLILEYQILQLKRLVLQGNLQSILKTVFVKISRNMFRSFPYHCEPDNTQQQDISKIHLDRQTKYPKSL